MLHPTPRDARATTAIRPTMMKKKPFVSTLGPGPVLVPVVANLKRRRKRRKQQQQQWLGFSLCLLVVAEGTRLGAQQA